MCQGFLSLFVFQRSWTGGNVWRLVSFHAAFHFSSLLTKGSDRLAPTQPRRSPSPKKTEMEIRWRRLSDFCRGIVVKRSEIHRFFLNTDNTRAVSTICSRMYNEDYDIIIIIIIIIFAMTQHVINAPSRMATETNPHKTALCFLLQCRKCFGLGRELITTVQRAGNYTVFIKDFTAISFRPCPSTPCKKSQTQRDRLLLHCAEKWITKQIANQVWAANRSPLTLSFSLSGSKTLA